MKARQLTTIAVLALWLGTAGAQSGEQEALGQHAAAGQEASAASQRDAERAAIEQARRRNAEQRTQAQTKCYQLFAVEDCLRDVRNQWREVESRLRAREVQLNDAERKEKAQQRLRQIEEKQASAAAATIPPASAAATTPPASAVVRKAEPTGRSGARENTAGSVKLRDREAAARASQQRERQQSQAAEQALREKESTERAAQARQRQLEVEKAAQARRAKREQEKADAAANGHKPAATLPTPP